MKRKKTAAVKKTSKNTSRLKHYSYVIFYSFLSVFVALFIFGFFTTGEPAQLCANSESCVKDLSGKFEPNQTQGIFLGKTVSVPQTIAKTEEADTDVLGDTTSNKIIKVDLSTQHLYAYEGDTLIMDFPVSTGKWGWTPTGTFKIWIKLKSTRMSGGTPGTGTYYNLPNVPYTMYFYNDKVPKSRGYGLHGAYWHNNFGHPMSHGCVNISPENAERLYNWAQPVSTANTTYATTDNPGTQIEIYGTAPQE